MTTEDETSGAYVPKKFEISGVSLYGERQDDGTIKIGTAPTIGDDHRTHVREFPETILVEGVVYTLENVAQNEWPGRTQLQAEDPSNIALRICWGEYA